MCFCVICRLLCMYVYVICSLYVYGTIYGMIALDLRGRYRVALVRGSEHGDGHFAAPAAI